MFVLEACLRGDFFDWKLSFGKQAAGTHDAEFQKVLVRTHSRVRGKSVAEPAITDTKFPRQIFHVQFTSVSILDATDREFDGI